MKILGAEGYLMLIEDNTSIMCGSIIQIANTCITDN